MATGITAFGALHTAISLVAVFAGIAALIRYKAISLRYTAGRVYVITTALTCLTGFFIFHHGGFGKPHALGVLTLIVLAVAALAGHKDVFGRASRYVEVIGYSLTLFFHTIPALTETGTRLPSTGPIFTNPEDPVLQKVIGVIFVLFAIGMAWQARQLRTSRRAGGDSGQQ